MIIDWTEAQTLLGAADTDQTTVEKILNAITKEFEREAHRHIEDYTATEIINGDGSAILYLKEQPRTVTTVHISTDQTWDTGSLVDTDTYNVDRVWLNRLGGNVWDQGFQNIQVVYQAGFENPADDEPDIWWAAQKTLQKAWSTLRAEQALDIDVVESVNKNDVDRKFRIARFLDDEVKEILRGIAPWQE